MLKQNVYLIFNLTRNWRCCIDADQLCPAPDIATPAGGRIPAWESRNIRTTGVPGRTAVDDRDMPRLQVIGPTRCRVLTALWQCPAPQQKYRHWNTPEFDRDQGPPWEEKICFFCFADPWEVKRVIRLAPAPVIAPAGSFSSSRLAA
jgi:hypothetical protein